MEIYIEIHYILISIEFLKNKRNQVAFIQPRYLIRYIKNKFYLVLKRFPRSPSTNQCLINN